MSIQTQIDKLKITVYYEQILKWLRIRCIVPLRIRVKRVIRVLKWKYKILKGTWSIALLKDRNNYMLSIM